MQEFLTFSTRADFRNWLSEHAQCSEGVWLLFGKNGGPKTLKAVEALEEALCFGWIDGQIQCIDNTAYCKYFSPRRQGSKWSAQNKALAEKLEQLGLMTDAGRVKIREAQENGQWDAPKPPSVTEEQVAFVVELLRGHEPAYTNFQNMPPSVRRTYTKGYFSTKTEAGIAKYLDRMIARLNQNLKPM